MKKLILASTSPRRKELLSKTDLLFEVIASQYEEDMTLPMEPKELVMYLSRGKAEAIAPDHEDAVIIGADTFVVFDGKVLGKPHTSEKAREMLQMLRGKTASILTGFTVIESATSTIVSKVDETKVYFKDFTDTEMEDYIATNDPLDKAGAFAIQGVGAVLIDHTEGDFEGAMGLPLKMLLQVLEGFGIIQEK